MVGVIRIVAFQTDTLGHGPTDVRGQRIRRVVLAGTVTDFALNVPERDLVVAEFVTRSRAKAHHVA